MASSRLQEIISRGVVGQEEQTLTWVHQLAPGGMDRVLGVRMGRAEATATLEGEEARVVLTVDCDLWCAGGEGTAVLKTQSRAVHGVPVRIRGPMLGEPEVRAELLSGPRSTGVRVQDDSIHIDFEAQVAVTVIAESRFLVRVYEVGP